MFKNLRNNTGNKTTKSPATAIRGVSKISFTKAQKEILKVLTELHLSVADIYRGALLAFASKGNPERVSQVCHSLRELSAIIPYFSDTGIIPTTEDTESDSKHREKLKHILATKTPRASLPEAFHDAITGTWDELNRWFISESHHQRLKAKDYSQVDETLFSSKVQQFEDLLYSAMVKRPFFEAIGEIDQLLAIASPTNDDLKRLLDFIQVESHYNYFFDKCDNPAWLRLLTKEGFFKTPRPPLVKDGYITFLGWPESRYLARIADREPVEVLRLIRLIPETKNQSVLDDFVDAALKMPVTESVQFVKLIQDKKWINSPYTRMLPRKIGDLTEKLARAGKESKALDLASALLDVQAYESPLYKRRKNRKNILYKGHPDARALFDNWGYSEILEKNMQPLIEKDPAGVLNILAQKLTKSLDIEDRLPKDSKKLYEYSHIWRPFISRNNHHHEDIKDIILDKIIAIIIQHKADTAALIAMLKVIQKHRHPIFRRIEMWFLKEFPKLSPVDIGNILAVKSIVQAYNLRREYWELSAVSFQGLSGPLKNKILKLIESGPDLKVDKGEDKKRVKGMKEDWRRNYMRPISAFLPKAYQKRYQELVKAYGDHEDDSGIIRTFGGPTSPKTKDELSSLPIPEIINYLATWTPPEQVFAEASPDGLGREFSGIVALSPDEFTKEVDLMLSSKLRLVYYVHYLYGLQEALKNGKCFDWEKVLNFCNKITRSNLKNFPKPNKHEMGSSDFRLTVIRLLGNGLVSNQCGIPFALRDKVWSIIELCAEDKDPSVRYEKSRGGKPFDASSLSINTIRGQAMHSLIKYSLWCSKNIFGTDPKVMNKLVPEAEGVLNRHLNLKFEATQTIRSVYGWYLPNLFYLNPAWVKKNLSKIFPKAKSKEELRYSAWEAYLSNNVYSDLFPHLRGEYLNALNWLGKKTDRKFRGVDVDECLPRHMVIAYTDGIADEKFINAFFKKAPAKARGEALSFIGRAMLQDKSRVTKKEKSQLARLKKLISSRLADRNAKDSEEFVELGWWFPRSPFGKKFNIKTLVAALKKTNGVLDDDHEVIEGLEQYSDDYPHDTAEALELYIKGPGDIWKLEHHSESIKNVLAKLLANRSAAVRKKAVTLIHLLGEKGLMKFGDLLSKP